MYYTEGITEQQANEILYDVLAEYFEEDMQYPLWKEFGVHSDWVENSENEVRDFIDNLSIMSAYDFLDTYTGQAGSGWIYDEELDEYRRITEEDNEDEEVGLYDMAEVWNMYYSAEEAINNVLNHQCVNIEEPIEWYVYNDDDRNHYLIVHNVKDKDFINERFNSFRYWKIYKSY